MTNALVEKLEDVDAAQRAGTAVEPRQKTVRDLVQEMEPQFRRALPQHVDAGRFTRLALTALRTTPKLAECSPESILAGLMQAAQLGLEIDAVRQQAHLIPRWNSRTRRNEASFQLGYKGVIDLAGRGGITIRTRTVYANDVFEYEDGLAPVLRHIPQLKGDRGDPWAYFAVATFSDDRAPEFVVMSEAEMVAHRDRFGQKNRQGAVTGPWVEFPESMRHKTLVHRLGKNLPLPVELATALAVEDMAFDVTPDLAELAPAAADSGASEIAEQGPVPPPVSNDSAPTADVPPAEAKKSALPAEGVDDPDRRQLAAYSLDQARQADHAATKAWQDANGIGSNYREWSAAQISQIIDWIHEEPEPAS